MKVESKEGEESDELEFEDEWEDEYEEEVQVESKFFFTNLFF